MHNWDQTDLTPKQKGLWTLVRAPFSFAITNDLALHNLDVWLKLDDELFGIDLDVLFQVL